MQFTIDNASNRPVYQQIVDQVKRDVALGRLVRDDKLPTVRRLAAQLVINPNTIAKAYRQMEQEGIITTKPGAGAFIALLDSNLSEIVRARIICERLEMVIVEAFHLQVQKESLREWFEKALEKFKFSPEKGLKNE
ncbi:MAG: hypothetical protein AMJ79_16140 [Phycisphaerae bacterium SM23_30]|nr:MAG: hypothetical protein AMJ79_16140 [Phycisphaerae bacterium SM23_30]